MKKMTKAEQLKQRKLALETFRIQCRWYAEALQRWEQMHKSGQLDPDIRKPSIPTFPVDKVLF